MEYQLTIKHQYITQSQVGKTFKFSKMVGKTQLVLEDVLTEKQVNHVLKQSLGDDSIIDLIESDVRPAVEGIAGFLGDHMKVVLEVDVQGERKKVHLFIKRLPSWNKPKVDFINEFNFYRREKMMFKILEEICGDVSDSNPWCVKAYIYTDSIFVMPDLGLEGYAPRHYLDALDSEHIFLATTAIARFHAAMANYETKKSIQLKRPYSTLQEVGNLLAESIFCDSPWLRTCSKLAKILLKTFSTKSYADLPDIESKLTQLFLDACDSFREYEGTINVILHKDLWVNNIMFKYENGKPVNAVLVDYQCLRYGPPTFDLMMFLYVTTEKSFRQEREKDIFDHYYSVFVNNLSDDSKKRAESLGYDKQNFLEWCERSRMFGMCGAIGIYPYVLMDPKTAQQTFDDPETYEKYLNEDRSEPVIALANKCEVYKRRNLEVTEEFVEKYVV